MNKSVSRKAIIAGIKFPHTEEDPFECSLKEIEELSTSAGFSVMSVERQSRQAPSSSHFMGKGKLEELAAKFSGSASVIIFNHELSPSQIRNVEKTTGFRALTRTEIILDIFAIHARSKAAKLQVEMATLSYQMPRIIGKGIEMSRIEGGIGMKGPGEQQLELDRRKIRARITAIKRELEHVSRERENQRKKRDHAGFHAAIIGYTNAGKSTLLNRLTRSGVTADNRLFVTLDTTTRKIWLGERMNATLTDTVGFIQDIPHGLIESFKSTFDNALSTDLLIHLVDLSSHDYKSRIQVVEKTLLEIESSEIPILMVFNKIDRVEESVLAKIRNEFPSCVCVSAKDGAGIDLLKETLLTYAGTLTENSTKYHTETDPVQ